MYSVQDIDALLLLAIGLASKRRPAELAQIIAANDLIHGSVPLKSDLAEAFHHLARDGLIAQVADGFTLMPDAVEILSAGRKKADNEERLIGIKAALCAYTPMGESPTIGVTAEQLSAAVQSHQASKEHAGKNLLVPKPQPVVDSKRPQRRQPLAVQRRKNYA
ncbi:MAG: hypothetical protein PHP85_14155 [Gallionella sp.]|nr:hypothetical protein [Gallionella sp.]